VSISTSKEPAKIAGMFDAIAGHYDTLNLVLSAGFDRRWRARTVAALGLSGHERVLDMCTGTADLAIEAATAAGGHAREVVGVDFSPGMLAQGHEKVQRADLGGRVRLARGDATRMPLSDGVFDVATVAFGLRNVRDPELTCREFHRVLKAGGRLAVLEFGSPVVPGMRTLYLWYFRRILPLIGRLVSRHGEAYSYLPASVLEFPSGDGVAAILRRAGFESVRWQTFTLGIVYLYLAEKAGRPDESR
jgi:demethylmenaquinone methyltransferase/2-methoxy-6-polyprenyl-1,4-benzoquinol methylase